MRSDPIFGPLTDIRDNISLAYEFVRDIGYSEFRTDRRTVYAVTRCLEIISEASRRLPPEWKARHPAIEWREIAEAGSVYRHAYQLVRDDIVWGTVCTRLEPLLAVVEAELARITDQ